ncbi:MAG: serine hydrolase [Lapillicoccus sp.]
MTDTSPVAPDPRRMLLPRAAPADVGVPVSAVEGLLDELAARSLELHSLMVVRHGQVAAEGWWAPYAPERVHLLYSLSKSFTSSAVGFCVAEGRFGLDDRIVDLLPDHVPEGVDPAVASLTVHHLISMSTGHREDTLDRAWALEPHDLVAGFLRLPPEEAVGSRHAYNNSTTYVLAALVEHYSGMPLLDYLRPRLLDPLGIGPARWDVDEHGQALGFSGLHLPTEAIAAFGQLLLQDGRWGEEQVLPPGWVALATRSHIDNDDDPSRPVDWRQGYGYQYWMARHGFRGDGAYGQFCVVVPDHDLVVATTACVEDMQQVLDVVWDRLLPALDHDERDDHDNDADADDDGYAAQARLRDRLAGLALPVVEVGRDDHSHNDPSHDDPSHDDPSHDVTFTVAAAGVTDVSPFAAGTTVSVAPDSAGFLVTIDLAGDAADRTDRTRVSVPCGRDRWAEGRLSGPGTDRAARGVPSADPTPVVCRGGWTGPETFVADLVLIETPHRIRLRGNGSTLEAAWNAPPLTGARLERHLPS